jgi:hypothetical protein
MGELRVIIRDLRFKVIRLANQETLQGLQKILVKAGTSLWQRCGGTFYYAPPHFPRATVIMILTPDWF